MKALALLIPVRHDWSDVHEDLEANLGDDLSRLAETAAGACVGFGEEVFDEAHADVVTHAVELGVDGIVVGLGGGVGESEVAAELGDDGAVCEGYDFGVDLLDAGSGGMVRMDRSIAVDSELTSTPYFDVSINAMPSTTFQCSLFAHPGSFGSHGQKLLLVRLTSRREQTLLHFISRSCQVRDQVLSFLRLEDVED